jgi:eukaryotic-like serine/threonine-protein kinase
MFFSDALSGALPDALSDALSDALPMLSCLTMRRHMSHRPPLWLFLAAATFLGYFCLLIYCDVQRPENPGVDYLSGDYIVKGISAGSAADRAGLKVGDDVVTIDGHPITNRLDLEARDINLVLNRPRDVMVVRDGFVQHVALTMGPPRAGYLRSKEELVLLLVRAMLLSSLLLGVFIAWKRPRDHVALVAAGLLATLGVFSLTLPYRMAVFWRGLPPVVGAALWVPFLSTACIGAWLFSFFVVFPYRRFRTPWLWLLSMVPIVVVLVPYAKESLRAVYRPDDPRGMLLSPYSRAMTVNIAYIGASLVMLVFKYWHLADVNERRRVRVLLLGSLTGWAAGAPVGIAYWRGDADLTHSMFGSNWMVLGTLLFLIFPISFGYAVLRHRLFDVRVIVRMGVRYALARRALLSLVPLLAVVLGGDILLHGREPLTDIVVARGFAYLLIAALAGVAYVYRRRWLDDLDRRFFRERYDARQILSRLVTDVRQVGSVHGVAPRVTGAIESALHAEFVAIVIRREGDDYYRTVAVTPQAHVLPAWSAASTLMQLARVIDKPLQGGAGDSGWLQNQLPAWEVAQLQAARVDCVVPIAPRAMLLLGIKRSEEPYGREDLELLDAIADSLAILLDREPATPQPATACFDECPTCGACYDGGSGACPREGARLVSGRVPRMLADRYRIERRLGRGGMGTVYAATDTTLDRVVAAKVVRTDLVGPEDAAVRFHAEARSAAKFAHPNVVTIHDFGVTPDGVGYLVMELLEGVTLRQELERQGCLPPAHACAVLRDAAMAVDAAHRHQLIHRDLKPENIFLVRSGFARGLSGPTTGPAETAKVLDFGLAKYVRPNSPDTPTAQHTHPGLLIGTPAYMSPEQLRGGDPGPHWDLWALTLVAYETLTGRHPFAGTLIGGVPGGINGYHDLISAPLASTSSACQDFFVRALSLDPAVRPQSAHEFIDQFQRVVE